MTTSRDAWIRRGKRIDRAAMASRYTKTEIARILCISKQSFADILHGRSEGTRHTAKLAEILQVPVGWIEAGGALPDRIRTVEEAKAKHAIVPPEAAPARTSFLPREDIPRICRDISTLGSVERGALLRRFLHMLPIYVQQEIASILREMERRSVRPRRPRSLVDVT